LIQLADVGDGEYRDRSSRFLTSAKAKELNCTFLKPGDLLIARMPDPLGRACIFPGDAKRAVTVVDVCIVRTGVREIDHRWLQWFINAPRFRVQVAGLQSGSTRKRISRGNLSTLLLPVPPSAEQRRIVAKIEELFSDLDAGVAALERVRANLKRYRAAVLKAAVEGHLTEEWRTRHPATEPAARLLERILAERRAKWEQDQLRKFKEAGKTPPKAWEEEYEESYVPEVAGLAAIPRSWQWVTLDQLTDEAAVGLDRGRAQQSTEPVGVPYVKMNNVTNDGRVILADIVYVQASAAEIARFHVREGDLLFNTRNSIELVGKVGFVGMDIPNLVYNNNLMRLRFPAGVLPAFVCNAMCSAGFRQRMELVKKATTNVAAVYAKDLFPLPIPLPPLAEQAEIIAEVDRRLSVANAAETQVEHALKRAARLRQAILKRAFEGKLVPQDPSDEPAAALLDRIKGGGGGASNGHRAVIRNGDNAAATPTERRSRARV